jgi:hypothetical protein
MYTANTNEQNVSWLAKASAADSMWAMSKTRSFREAGAPSLPMPA